MKKLIVLATLLAFSVATGCGGSSTGTTKLTTTSSNITTTEETKIK